MFSAISAVAGSSTVTEEDIQILREEIHRQELAVTALKEKLSKLEKEPVSSQIRIEIDETGFRFEGESVTAQELQDRIETIPTDEPVSVVADRMAPFKRVTSVFDMLKDHGIPDVALSAEGHSASQEEKEAAIRSYKHWKSIGSGTGSNAVRSPFGRYLILKNEDTLLCLKLEKHLSSATDQGKAARYSWVQIVAGETKSRGTFVMDEDPESAAASSGSYWIELAGFRCEWSFGDWVYFDENLPQMKIARTEFTEEDEIAEQEVHLWLSRTAAKSFIEDDPTVRLLEGIQEIESGSEAD